VCSINLLYFTLAASCGLYSGAVLGYECYPNFQPITTWGSPSAAPGPLAYTAEERMDITPLTCDLCKFRREILTVHFELHKDLPSVQTQPELMSENKRLAINYKVASYLRCSGVVSNQIIGVPAIYGGGAGSIFTRKMNSRTSMIKQDNTRKLDYIDCGKSLKNLYLHLRCPFIINIH